MKIQEAESLPEPSQKEVDDAKAKDAAAPPAPAPEK